MIKDLTFKETIIFTALVYFNGKVSNKELRGYFGAGFPVTEISSICSALEEKGYIKRFITKTNKVQYELLEGLLYRRKNGNNKR